jgi:hypothetical protein
MANLSGSQEERRKSIADIWELYRADFASSDESRYFVFLPTFDRRGIPEDTVEVV